MTLKTAAVGVAGLLTYGCCTPPASEPIDSITLQEDPCFGTCPVYSMTIKSNDTYELDAGVHTRTPGMTSGALPPGSWAQADAAITASGFYTIPGPVTPGNPACGDLIATDLPPAEITVVDAEPMTSSIALLQYYPGCFNSPHKPALDTLIEELRDAMSYDSLVAPAP